MPIRAMILELSYPQICQQLAAADYVPAGANEVGTIGAVCDSCGSILNYQAWSQPGSYRAFAVCVLCNKAVEIQ